MRAMIVAGSLVLFLVGCGTREPLVVKQFTVREVDSNTRDDLMVRGEIQKRLYGAIAREDREKRKGQYYSVRWRANPAGGPVKVRFQYRQAATGSRLRELVQTVDAGRGTGVVEFSVAGDSYLQGGRVLAWRMILSQDGQHLAEKKSFLWE